MRSNGKFAACMIASKDQTNAACGSTPKISVAHPAAIASAARPDLNGRDKQPFRVATRDLIA
jgi:hypothetical protein